MCWLCSHESGLEAAFTSAGSVSEAALIGNLSSSEYLFLTIPSCLASRLQVELGLWYWLVCFKPVLQGWEGEGEEGLCSAEWLPAAVCSPCGRAEGVGALLWDAARPCRSRPRMLLLKWVDSVCLVLVKTPVLWVERCLFASCCLPLSYSVTSWCPTRFLVPPACESNSKVPRALQAVQ